MVHITPFNVKEIGSYNGSKIIRVSHFRVFDPNFIPKKDVYYSYTPHTLRTNDELKEVKHKFDEYGAKFFVEVVWKNFQKRCESLGMECIPSYYELGVDIEFPECSRELYPTHFGRSAFYDNLEIKHLVEILPFAKQQYKKTGKKFLITAGRCCQATPEELTKGYPYIDLQVHHPQKWLKEVIAHVGCNVTATDSDAGPRLYTYAARMGIGTVFIEEYIKEKMGMPLPIFEPYCFMAKSLDPDEIAKQVEKACAIRGQKPLTKGRAVAVIRDAFAKKGFHLNKLKLF